jgi:hypothetical protein
VTHRIADDLENHLWYLAAVRDLLDGIERYLANWSAFEDAVENA